MGLKERRINGEKGGLTSVLSRLCRQELLLLKRENVACVAFLALALCVSLLAPIALYSADSLAVSTAPAAAGTAGALIKSQKADDRHKALDQMRLHKEKVSAADMNEAFSREKEPGLKTGMLRLLSAAPGGAVQVLMNSLKTDPSPEVRQSAAQELGRYAGKAAVIAALGDALKKDKVPEVRYACALSLSFSNTAAADAALDEAAKDPDQNLRRQAAFSLKKHTSARASAILKRLERDTDAAVRNMAKKP